MPPAAVSVISEVYGAGGGAGATYNADYVELSNPYLHPRITWTACTSTTAR